eukprot:Em0854g1a
MMEPQLVITTRDPCGHYEATLTPMFGIITGVQTSPVELESIFDVVGLSVNISTPMRLVCLFNTGSLARGCLVYLTDTGVTYCRVVWRSLDTPDNMSLCPSSNGPLNTGVSSVEV